MNRIDNKFYVMDINNIIIGDTYLYYDDGKIRESRKSLVIIKDIVPFDKIDDTILSLWNNEVIKCHWLYSETTDYFIKGKLIEDCIDCDIIFVRTIDNRWFSLGFWAGILMSQEFCE